MACLPPEPPRLARRLELHPAPEPPAPPPPPRPPAREPEHPGWAHPALTGLTAAQWDQLTAALATPHQAQREAALYIARGGPPTRKPAVRHPPALTLAGQVLITVLRQRFRLPGPSSPNCSAS